jgi:hypothetical protein
MTHSPVLNQIEANIRAIGRQERTLISQPHFELYISPAQEERLSFATPLAANPAGWTGAIADGIADAIADMQAAFAQQGKRPRLEYIADLHPTLAAALEQAGFVCESRTPVMVLPLVELAPPPAQPPQAHYLRLTAVDTPLLKPTCGARASPTAVMAARKRWTGCPTSNAVWPAAMSSVRLWPRATICSPGRSSKWARALANWPGSGRTLNGAVRSWPTPSASAFWRNMPPSATPPAGSPPPKERSAYTKNSALPTSAHS